MLVRITSPNEPVITLADAREHLRAPEGQDDGLIQRYIDAATGELDGADAWLGRALVNQTWRLSLDSFPERIALPLTSPKPSGAGVVTSIAYIDQDGAVQTLDSSQYVVLSGNDPICVEPAFEVQWPSTRPISGAVTIIYVAGYGAAAAVPDLIKQYIRMRCAQWYENREATMDGALAAPTPFVRDMLESLRLRGAQWQ